MRRPLIGLVVALTTAFVPVLAFASNQEVADQIKQSLDSKLKGHEIMIKVQDGTVVLNGHVQTQEQMKAALKVVYQTPGVTRVVNDMAVASSRPLPMAVQQPQSQQPIPIEAASAAASQAQNPLRNEEKSYWAKFGDQIGSAFGGNEATPASHTQPANDTAVAAASAEESVVEPQQVTPQRARPMATTNRGAQRVAMRQVEAPTQATSQGAPLPMYAAGTPAGVAPVRYDRPCLPNYAWPSYAAYPNYAAVTYPKQYSPTAWPYIGPFYPYPQVPMGWRKVTLEWSDGWWYLDFKDQPASCWQR